MADRRFHGVHGERDILRFQFGEGLVEIIDDHDGDTYRAVYTVRFEGVVYVLHAFQKKSKSGIATPRKDLALIDMRLRRAEKDHREWRASETKAL